MNFPYLVYAGVMVKNLLGDSAENLSWDTLFQPGSLSLCHSVTMLDQIWLIAASSTTLRGLGILSSGGKVRSSNWRRNKHCFRSESIVVHAPP